MHGVCLKGLTMLRMPDLEIKPQPSSGPACSSNSVCSSCLFRQKAGVPQPNNAGPTLPAESWGGASAPLGSALAPHAAVVFRPEAAEGEVTDQVQDHGSGQGHPP
ncbi:hypothetical protein HaLaN_25244, partial [Haematococcus lacustris]